jgi:type I restriction enzyme S subunit
MYASMGEVTRLQVPATISQAILALFPKEEIDVDWLALWLQYLKPALSLYSRTTTQGNLSADVVRRLPVLVPPPAEQRKIADLVARATHPIDEAIASKKRLVELLEEERRAGIAQVVTGGLDPTVHPVESGVPWLGEIPEHWDLVPNRAVMRPSRHTVGHRSERFTLLSLTLRGVIPRDLEDMRGKFPASFDSHQMVEPGDFVFCLFDMDETPRTVGLSNETGMITGAYDVYKPTGLADSEYLYYLFLSFDHRKQLKPLYRGLRKTIPGERFAAMKICLPPREEQAQIVQHIDKEVSRIDQAVRLAERQIELLAEYRAVLIADAVTGKLDLSAADSRQLNTIAEKQ